MEEEREAAAVGLEVGERDAKSKNGLECARATRWEAALCGNEPNFCSAPWRTTPGRPGEYTAPPSAVQRIVDV